MNGWAKTGEHRESWAAAISAWEQSEISVRASCRLEGLPGHSFYWWRRKLWSEVTREAPRRCRCCRRCRGLNRRYATDGNVG